MIRIVLMIAAGAAMILLAPIDAAAQSRLSLDLAGGPHVPVGSAARAADHSAALSIGLTHRLSARVNLTTEFQVAAFSGGPVQDRTRSGRTGINMQRWALGGEALITPLSSSWRLWGRVAAGFSSVGSDPVLDPARPPSFTSKVNDDVFTLSAGLQLGRPLGPLLPFFRVQPEVYFLGSSLRELQPLDDEIGESGSLVGIPLQIGLRIGL